ncbi:MAG: hypothetical protein JNG86_10895 [Verrucomicrobiaceae bacterium]|nr:hypothetical protein [Verrucomicrobiaceae bacterium]
MSVPVPAQAAPHSPYGEFLAELDEIERHKWHISEREGVDVGFERALNEWSVQHRAAWRRMRNQLRDQTADLS